MATAYEVWPTRTEHCSACGYELNATAGVGQPGAPKPDDVSICLKCGHITMFDLSMRRREVTAQERADIMAQKNIARTVSAIKQMRTE